MLTSAQFHQWYQDFAARYPAVAEYAKRAELPSVLIDTWHQAMAAFDLETLQEVTRLMIKGDLDEIPNTELGHFGSEIRKRAREVNERRRRKQPQEWEQTTPLKATELLQETKMAWMLKCGMAADRLLGENGRPTTTARTYRTPNSVKPQQSSYDAAIIMADEHTAFEETQCLETFQREGLTWQQIQEVAKTMGTASVVQQLADEGIIT